MLRPATSDDLLILQGWFPDPDTAYRWGGPGLRHPFGMERFLEDIRWGILPSWSLAGPANELLGFGQYYLNHGRCHLARIAVAPDRRGRGLGRELLRELIRVGLRDLGVRECSLFVLNDNEPAIRCYRAVGFEPREFPDWTEPAGAIGFMVRQAARRGVQRRRHAGGRGGRSGL